jgi:hypothetical protein
MFRGGDQQKPPVEAEENNVGIQLNQIRKRSGGHMRCPLLNMGIGYFRRGIAFAAAPTFGLDTIVLIISRLNSVR